MKKVFVLLLLCYSISFTQVQYSKNDSSICYSKFNFAVEQALKDKPVYDVVAEIGKSFLGTEYAASTLDKNESEQLVINLTGLDCTTFLENALTFARLIKSGKTSFSFYQEELTKIRYRSSIIDKYPSRLHYFSDWIFDNSKKGIIKDVTNEIGGVPYPMKVGFMSANRDKYKQIASNDNFYNSIRNIESEINSRNYFYIPKKDIVKIEDNIKNGSLIAITTNIDGLDISHVGIAVKEKDGRIHLLHAPIVGSKVQITEKPLADYLAGNKRQTGIMVLEPVEPFLPEKQTVGENQ